jgi:glycosyltransferase involved in cell wall biosynthesis
MEGTPVVGMRALGAGLAILGSDVGGIPDVIQNGGNGYLCAVNDLEAFAARLREMLSQPDRLMSMKAASRQLASRFDLKGIADKLEQIFLAVVTTSKK